MDIIDGYNVIFEMIGHDNPELDAAQLRSERKEFVSKVQNYSDQFSRPTYIAFDGPQKPKPWFGRKKKSDYLTVLFGNDEEEADDIIVELVERESNRGSITVVTRDRQLADEVEDLGATVEDGESYLNRINNSLQDEITKKHPGEPPEKYGQKPVSNVDAWMEFFGIEEGQNFDDLKDEET